MAEGNSVPFFLRNKGKENKETKPAMPFPHEQKCRTQSDKDDFLKQFFPYKRKGIKHLQQVCLQIFLLRV